MTPSPAVSRSPDRVTTAGSTPLVSIRRRAALHFSSTHHRGTRQAAVAPAPGLTSVATTGTTTWRSPEASAGVPAHCGRHPAAPLRGVIPTAVRHDRHRGGSPQNGGASPAMIKPTVPLSPPPDRVPRVRRPQPALFLNREKTGFHEGIHERPCSLRFRASCRRV
jgi:hypothetical protein